MRDAGQWNKKVDAFFRTLCKCAKRCKRRNGQTHLSSSCCLHRKQRKSSAMERKNLFCERPLHGVGRRLKDAIFTSHDWVCDAANKVSFILQFQALYRTCVRLVQCSSQNKPIKQRKSARLNPQMHEKEQNKRYTA